MRRFGYTLLAAGLLMLAYVTVVLLYGDPVTGIYAHYEQRHLRKELRAQQTAAVATADRSHRWVVADGSPLGTIRIPAIGVNAVFVQGTSDADLDKAPGHYANTSLPGSGRVVAIAAHRTTYGAWFRHIDSIRKHDPIYIDFRGRTYTYRATGHRVVVPTDWSIIRYRGYEKLALSSCHPVYSASHRWVVFARLAGSRPDSS